MWAALSAAAQAIHSNVQLASPYTLNWNHTIDVTDGIDAIPEAAHLASSNVYVKPVTLFADTVQNRVQAVVLGGLEVTGSLWEKLLGFSSTQVGNNSQAVMTAASVARVDATRAIAFHCPTLCAGTFGTRHSPRITFFVSPNSIQIVNLSTHKTRKLLPRTHGAGWFR
jgi:hypothetical protein